MTQILINLKSANNAGVDYNNISIGAGLVSLTGPAGAATSLTFQEISPPISSIGNGNFTDRYGYEGNALEGNWYRDATPAKNRISGSLPAGETITSIKFFGGASQSSGRSTDITINSVTKTHDATNDGAAPVEWAGGDLTGITLPFDIDWVRSAGASFGYAGVIEITTVGAAGPTLTGPASTTEGSATVAAGTDLDTVTTFNLISGTFSIAQTIDSATATTLNYVAESGANDCVPATPVSGVPLEATISAAGVTPYQIQQEADDGTNPAATFNITLNGEATHEVVQTMIAVANTTPGESIFGTDLIAVEDDMQAYVVKAANGMNITWAADGTFTTDADQTEIIDVAYFAPSTGQWSCLALTISASGVGATIPPASRTSVFHIAAALRALETFTHTQTNELVVEWLESEGISRTTLNGMLYGYLGGLGYTGSIEDRMKKWRNDA